jgi:Fe-S cluster assembly protein SufD
MKSIILTQSGDYEYILDQDGDEIDVVGRFKLSGEEKLSLNIHIIHRAKNTKSFVSIKSAVSDKAKASIIGTIIVEDNAAKSESFLEEKVLLLSSSATAEAIPNLEIKTNDVKCSHAATIGQLDEEQLFYVSSRGIPKKEAKTILADAFLSDSTKQVV